MTKKTLFYIAIFLIIIGYVIFTKYYVSYKIILTDNIVLEPYSDTLFIEPDGIKVEDNYTYYQINIYPSKFNIICESDNTLLCDNILLNSTDKIKNYSLSYASKSLDKNIPKVEEIPLFNDKNKIEGFLNDLFDILYTSKQKGDYVNNINDSVLVNNIGRQLNQMETDCLDGIKIDVIAGSYNYEQEIQDRFESTCDSLKNITTEFTNNPDLISDELESNIDSLKFGIEIEEIKIEYKFFSQEKGHFKEVSTQNDFVPYSQKFQTNMSLN